MAVRIIDVGGREVVTHFDPTPQAAERQRVVWRLRIVDELDQQPLEPPFEITATPGLDVVSAPGGLIALTAKPTERFPDLVASPAALDLEVGTSSYLPVTLSTALHAHPLHRAEFDPVLEPQPVQMQTRPAVLRGRVRRAVAGTLRPVAGAEVRIVGYWSAVPAPLTSPPPEPAEVVELRPALAQAFALGDPVRAIGLAAGSVATALQAFATRGSDTLELGSRAGIAVGDVLAIDPSDPDRAEFVRVSALPPGLPAAFPGAVTLAAPLVLDHREGTVVESRVTQAPGPVHTLSRVVIRGGVNLFVDDMTGLDATGFVELGAGPVSGILRVRALVATTDADGFFRLPPVQRMARAWVSAGDATSTLPVALTWKPARDGTPQWLDMVLPP